MQPPMMDWNLEVGDPVTVPPSGWSFSDEARVNGVVTEVCRRAELTTYVVRTDRGEAVFLSNVVWPRHGE